MTSENMYNRARHMSFHATDIPSSMRDQCVKCAECKTQASELSIKASTVKSAGKK